MDVLSIIGLAFLALVVLRFTLFDDRPTDRGE